MLQTSPRTHLSFAAAATLALLFAGGCSEKTKSALPNGNDDPPAAPTLDACPADTDAASVELRGGKGENTSIWLQAVDAAGAAVGPATRLVPQSEGTRWQREYDLGAPGTTVRFNLHARDDRNRESTPTAVCEITRTRSTACEGFAVDAVPASTEAEKLTVEGDKAADAVVKLEELVVGEADGSTRWSAEVDLVLGENRFVFSASTADGEGDCDPQVVLVQRVESTELCAPEVRFDGNGCPSAGDVYAFAGSVCDSAGPLSVWVRRGGEDTAGQIVDPGTGAFSADVALELDAAGAATLFFHARDAEGNMSAETRLDVTIDIVAPAAPTLDPLDACTRRTVMPLAGDREAGAEIIDADGATVVAAGPDLRWGGSRPLEEGSNTISLRARDACGNVSEAVTAEVTSDRTPPELTVDSPSQGDVLREDSVSVDGNVEDVGCGVDSIEICVGDSCQNASPEADGSFALPDVDISDAESCEPIPITLNAADGAGNLAAVELTVGVLRGMLELSQSSTLDATNPSIARGAGDLYFVAWQDRTTNGTTHDIYFRTWDGTSCSETVRVTASDALPQEARDGILGADNRNPVVAATSTGDVHLVWEHHGNALSSGNDPDLLHLRWEAGTGALDGTVTVLSDTDEDSRSPALTVGGDDAVWVLWSEQDSSGVGRRIRQRRIGSGEASSEVCAGADADRQPEGTNTAPSVTIDHLGRMHVVFQGDGDRHDPINGVRDEDIYYCMRDGGGRWSSWLRMSDDADDGRSFRPDVAALPSGEVAIVWHDDGAVLDPHDDLDVYMRVGADTSFGSYLLVSAPVAGAAEGNASDAQVAVDPDTGNIHVLWVDQRDFLGKGADADVVHRRFAPTGEDTTVISDLPEARCAISPDFVLGDNGSIIAVWQAHADRAGSPPCLGNPEDDRDIFLRVR